MDEPRYPEHEKLSERSHEHDVVQAFVEFLMNDGRRSLCAYNAPEERGSYVADWRPLMDGEISALIAEYFEVDMDAFEREKVQMLEDLRNKK